MLDEKQLNAQWVEFLTLIENEISEPRKSILIDFYNKYEERFILLSASLRPQYHNCFPGGYIDHILRVTNAAIDIYSVWLKYGILSEMTREEVVFSAIHHDLGKFGTFENESYLPNPSEWHVKNRGEIYAFNNKLEFMTVPDRSLWTLNELGISVSLNEYLAIKLHDGLYDDANKPYLMTWSPETKLRTSLPYIIHQADLLASRVEFEREWLPKFKEDVKEQSPKPTQKKTNLVNENVVANGGKLNDVMANFFN